MSKSKLKWAAASVLALVLLGAAGFGGWTWYVESTRLFWPEFPANKDGKPQAVLKLAGNRDFGYACGHIIPATLYVQCPTGWEPEGALTVKGDLDMVGSKSEREVRSDGWLYIRYDISLQTVDPKNFKWETLPSHKFSTGGKLESVDFMPIRISGSPTFDGNKKAPLKTPEQDYLFGNHWAITISLLAVGGIGALVFPVLLMRSFRRKPKVKKPKPVAPPDPKARVQAAFAAVIGGDWVSEEGMKELALAVREYFKIPEHKFPSALVFSDLGRDQIIGHVLEICEGAYIWKNREFVPERDLDALAAHGAHLLELPAGTFGAKETVDPWQDRRCEAIEAEDNTGDAQAEPQLSAEEVERIASEVLSGE